MDTGVRRQGEDFACIVLCTNASGVPTDPDSCPTWELYSGDSPVLVGKAPIIDKQATTGLFEVRFLLDETTPVGTYLLIVRWKISSHNGVRILRFRVVAGGKAGGIPISMAWWRLPEADRLIRQTTAGRLMEGRNPRR